MKKYFIIDSRDSSTAFNSVLSISGYERSSDPDTADFLLYDLNRVQNKNIHYKFATKPKFLYPHTPFTWWIWDGVYNAKPVNCNFVGTEAAKLAMRAYGYPYKVEVCGFSRCEVKPWQPTEGKILLYAPNHPIGKIPHLRKPDKPVTNLTFRKIIKIAPLFERVIVRYGHTLETSELWDPKLPNLEFQKSNLTTPGSLKAIKEADIVIAGQTMGYLAVAQGKPTIFYNQRGVPPYESSRSVNHYLKYLWIDYPVQLSDFSGPDIIEFAKTPNALVEKWKTLNIGEKFNPDKVISVIREYVK